MKTHTSRWQRTNAGLWELRARKQDGGVVLGTIRVKRNEFGDATGRYTWEAAGQTGEARFYAAQRAVRRALRGNGE